ncbi:MAG: RNA methyltransferase [Burkholderiaceae bacterium]
MKASVVTHALDRMRIVLVEPSHPGNIGAAARAIKVMGLSRLALVAPRYADALSHPDAIALASGASDVLENATVHASLADALADTTHAIAMSARGREFSPPLFSLREAAREAIGLVSRAPADMVAFVFGSERYGLSNDDVLRCQARCRIEASDVYASLNLAQAVQLVAYECRLAANDLIGTPMRPPSPSLASHEEREALIAHFEEALIAIDYLDPEAPKKLMPRLRRLFARARFEAEEVQWLRGIAKSMLRATKSKP